MAIERRRLEAVVPAVAAILAAACGGGGGGGGGPPPDTTPPSVVSTSPGDGAGGVLTTAAINATFSEDMDVATLSGSTFVVTRGTSTVSGSISYDVPTRTATFTPGSALFDSTTYVATITTGAKDAAGNPMAAAHAWSFTTKPRGGTLDPSFGTNGVAITSFDPYNASAAAVAIQGDGKIVAAGNAAGSGTLSNFALVRYGTDGSLDPTFGAGGRVTTPLGPSRDEARAVAIQADGKIVAAGFCNDGTYDDFALVRYASDGTLDPGFGVGGVVVTSLSSSNDGAYAVAIQPDGKIVAAGDAWDGSQYAFALVRVGTDGSPDASFGTNGVVTMKMGSVEDHIRAMALQPDGKIVAAGYSKVGSTYDFAVARYGADGGLDTGFSGGGKVITSVRTYYDQAHAVAVQADGRIVVAGTSMNASLADDVALVRYTSDGALDAGFGTGGIVVSTGADGAVGLALQADGKIVTAGRVESSSAQIDFAVSRFNADGSPDQGFGMVNGTVVTSVNAAWDGATAVAIQPDGKIVAAGATNRTTVLDWDFALVRYLP